MRKERRSSGFRTRWTSPGSSSSSSRYTIAVRVRTLTEAGLTVGTAFSVKPEKVAAAALRAIDKRKAEIVVNLGPGRLLKALMDYFPSLGPAINRLSGADKLMASVADYREATRTQQRTPHTNPECA